MGSYENDSAVWKLSDSDNQGTAILKIGTHAEIERINTLNALLQQVAPQVPLLDIDIPVVLKVFDKDFTGLPESVRQQIQADLQASRTAAMYDDDADPTGIRDGVNRMQVPFLISTVDANGLVAASNVQKPNRETILEGLNGVAVTAEEWNQVRFFFEALHKAGFEHGETFRNLYFKRLGGLKMSMIDFEPPAFGSSQDNSILNLWESIFLAIRLSEPNVVAEEEIAKWAQYATSKEEANNIIQNAQNIVAFWNQSK